MALNLVSDNAKNQAIAALENVHDTFARTITAYKDAELNITAVTPEYNSIYGSNGLSIEKSVVSSEFTARIKKYNTPSEEYLEDGRMNAQFKIPIPKGTVRIKVEPIGFNFIKDAKRIELDGKRYSIMNDSIPKTIGPFGPQYYAFYLAPIDPDG